MSPQVIFDIHTFCNKDSDSVELYKQPFALEGRAIATDGKRLIIAPLEEGIDPLGDDLAEVSLDDSHWVRRLVAAATEGSSFEPLPRNVRWPDHKDCSQCYGTGKVSRINCLECDGKGELEFDNGFNVYGGFECKSCHGEKKRYIPGGDITCPNCNGNRVLYAKGARVNIMGVRIDPGSIEPVCKRFGFMVMPAGKALLFKFGQYAGAILGEKAGQETTRKAG